MTTQEKPYIVSAKLGSRPKRAHVRDCEYANAVLNTNDGYYEYDSLDDAMENGYHPCRKCLPQDVS